MTLMVPPTVGGSSITTSFPIPTVEPPPFDPTIFGLSTDFDTLMGDPLDDFLNSFNTSGVLPDPFSTDFSAPPSETLPMLPPPPPETPAVSPPIEQPASTASIPPRSRRRAEVDESNILTSTRSRVPSERKRIAQEDITNQVHKKKKTDKHRSVFTNTSQVEASNVGFGRDG
ncbi:hypothetical protein B0H12DRAFT_1078964 [Mycena haematopus]|nr:hypothetical protein B0H12DRAFT_1078964 [Mycena haematopus]